MQTITIGSVGGPVDVTVAFDQLLWVQFYPQGSTTPASIQVRTLSVCVQMAALSTALTIYPSRGAPVVIPVTPECSFTNTLSGGMGFVPSSATWSYAQTGPAPSSLST